MFELYVDMGRFGKLYESVFCNLINFYGYVQIKKRTSFTCLFAHFAENLFHSGFR